MSNQKTNEMDGFTRGQLTELCQLVYRECKPCAMIFLKDEDIEMAENICMMENCKYKAVYLSDGWKSFWIYIRDEISEIIETLPEKPETKADYYLIGSLFGYSNNTICNSISTQHTSNFAIEINGLKYPIYKKVFELIKATSIERDNYKLYVKSLKREIRDLKTQKGELNKQCIHLSIELQETEKQLRKSRSRERKWYHFF